MKKQQIQLSDLQPGMLIMFLTSRGDNGIGKIQSIDPNFQTILMHNMIRTLDFTPIRGRFGGLNINLDQITQIIQIPQ